MSVLQLVIIAVINVSMMLVHFIVNVYQVKCCLQIGLVVEAEVSF